YDSGIFLESCESCVFNVGLTENEDLPSVYPNPANDKVYLFDSAELAFVQIYGLDGSLIHKTTCTGTLNVENLESGQYIIEFDLNGSINRSRIVIIH
ncbi:MAG: T9SS type A sorting domain-containing protein, partial [Bacteroidetes bacterium]